MSVIDDFREFQKRRDAVGNIDPRNEPHRQLFQKQADLDKTQAWSEYSGKPSAVYRGQPVDYPVANQSQPIPSTINVLDSNLIQLHQALANLTERLFPVLGPVPPIDPKAPNGGFALGSPDRVLDRLVEFVWRTRVAIDQVAELSDRIQV